ncbi:MAG: hypothetical protein ACI9J2_000749 [Saprospiraceae bacterium]|jgi:hypothetical protein
MIKIIFLVALLKVLDVTRKPFLCAGLYGALVCITTLVFGYPIGQALFVGAITLAISTPYFWLLTVYNKGIGYWLFAIAGLTIALI